MNHLPAMLRARDIGWAELSRRTLLPGAVVDRLRAADANPPLDVAQRLADALGVPIDEVWRWRK